MQVENEVKQDEFRVGDVVYCVLYGKGAVTVIKHLDDTVYPICVEIEDTGEECWYTEDGKPYHGANRTLFFSEPKVEASVIRPFAPTLVGKRVVVEEHGCNTVCITVEQETRGTFSGGGYGFNKDRVRVYEVSSENLLKKD